MPNTNGTLAGMGELGTVRSYPAGTQLYRQEETTTDAYLIHDGVVKLTWTTNEGNETIVGLRWPGSFLGASSLMAGLPNPASATALSPVVLEQIAANRFFRMLNTNRKLVASLNQAQSHEILEQTRALGELACLPARERLRNLLERLRSSVSSELCLPDGRMRLPFKKKELAALLSITPEHLSRTMDELVAEGSLVLRGQWIVPREIAPDRPHAS